ncbi:DEAD/DEAH box helicase [Virgibacillus xinjiangensis]|uniref:DEAD/DEAH box helicase n=1 Tax=Virgibacillus xinjiangensis TaxID=393090 RepID=A0ABV7CSG8_9BACI
MDWLIIDEAGQAKPQMAVGGIWRAKYTVAVGDPLQIEPVVTTPPSIYTDLANYFDISSSSYFSPHSSVQSIADLGNPYGKNLAGTWIGLPLWVHRRCLNPMFKISNEIAYDGNMVLATQENDTFTFSGQSEWIDVKGESVARQYVEAQGERLLILLQTLIDDNDGSLPNVYIISPFKKVADELKILLKKRLPTMVSGENSIKAWVRESVGTVHTFQGKEAEIVIFCLGVDETQKGAAKWATDKPNLINVAVTRAKYRLYVIGDKNIWRHLPYMETVEKSLTW